MLKPDDVVVEIVIQLKRDGGLCYITRLHGPVAAKKVVIAGMLAAVTSLYAQEFKPIP